MHAVTNRHRHHRVLQAAQASDPVARLLQGNDENTKDIKSHETYKARIGSGLRGGLHSGGLQ